MQAAEEAAEAKVAKASSSSNLPAPAAGAVASPASSKRRASMVVSMTMAKGFREMEANIKAKYDEMHKLLIRSHDLYVKNEANPEMPSGLLYCYVVEPNVMFCFDSEHFQFENSLMYANKEPTNSYRSLRYQIKGSLTEMSKLLDEKVVV